MPTKIEWTHLPGTTGEAWNPVTGCTPVSEGCRNCYAKRMARRLAGRFGYPEAPHHFDVTLRPDRLDIPLRWRKPRTVFVCSMGDLFHEDVDDEFIAAVFGIMAAANRHTYQVLTKRPERMLDLLGHHAESMARKVDIYKHVAFTGRIDEVFAAERVKPVEGWPGYFVTTKGRILSERNHGGNRDANILHEMKPQAGEQGHSRVELQVKGVSTRPLVHRLVLESFDRPAKEGEQSCHIDGNATNNCLWNLRWGSQSNNWDDSKRHGTRRRYSKINAGQAAEIREQFLVGESVHAIASDYAISDTQVRNIGRGDQWKPEHTPEWPLSSVWLGVSAENQEAADQRIPLLLETPAAVRFVSLEPLLGPISLSWWIPSIQERSLGFLGDSHPFFRKESDCLSWVIAGGESGPGARPMDPDWVRLLRDECQAAGTPFFFKQWGAWKAGGRASDSRYIPPQPPDRMRTWKLLSISYRVGKKAAGRTLDGRTWDEFPQRQDRLI